MIIIDHVSLTYPGSSTKALDDISLTIPSGSMFGLLGPNGAGKTTLISVLSGLLPYSDGSILIDHQELRTWNNTLPPCALVPQSLAFYPQLTAQENLAFFAAMLRISKPNMTSEIDRCIELTQLGNYRHKRAHTFSGGLKRRLNIAIGLLNSPSILFLDEPTVGIDAQSRHFILESIKTINQNGTTVIYTSHYMEEVESLCDKIAIIDHGKILLHGTLRDILSKQLSVTITSNTEITAQLLEKIRQHFPQCERVNRQLFIALNHQQELNNAINLCNALHINIQQLHYGNQQLEQLFLDKTDRHLRD